MTGEENPDDDGADDPDGGVDDGAPERAGPERVPPDEAGVEPATLRSADVERLFPILEAATADDPLAPDDRDRLLSVLEAVVLDPRPASSDDLDRLLDVLESTVVDATDPDDREVGGVLSVLETAVPDPARFDRGDGNDPPVGLDDLDLELDVDPLTSDVAREGPLGELLDAFGAERRRAEGTDERGRDDPVPDDVESDGPVGTDDAAGEVDPYRVARLLTVATRRATGTSVRSGVRLGVRMARVAATAESPAELLDETRETVLGEFRRRGVDVDRGSGEREGSPRSGSPGDATASEEHLRERGARLLRRSADVDTDDGPHPAFSAVLDDLAPDEARVLRLLATEGPQPALDVRDRGLIPLTSELVAVGLSMLDEEAGLRHGNRLPAYLDNLRRLGLVVLSEEPVDNQKRYEVIEAQPDVDDAMDRARRPTVDRRSVHLTAFGVDFCRTCLPVDVEAEDAAGAFDLPDEG